MNLRKLALLATLLLSPLSIAAQDPESDSSELDQRWRREVIGYEQELPILLGEMADVLESWYAPKVARSFRGEYGETFRQSPQVEHWIASYLDFRALLPGTSEATLRESVKQSMKDAHEIITQRVGALVRSAKKNPGQSPFPPGVSAESWAELELRRFLSAQGLALLTKILAERSIDPPTFADLQKHYFEHPLRWEGSIRASMIFLSYIDPNTAKRYDAATRISIARMAEELCAQARSADADFAELARRRSEDVHTAGKGGALGWIEYAQSNLPEEATNRLFETPAGNVSNAVETRRGLYIFLVHERQLRPAPSLSKIEGRVAEDLRRERARRFILARRLEQGISER